MGSAYKAFVSSTFEDLKTHRALVIDALGGAGIFIDPMEDWTAEPDEPKRFSVERLGGCAPTRIRPARRDIQHHAAGISGAIDRGIDVLVFMLDENALWPRRFDDQVHLELKPWWVNPWLRPLYSAFSFFIPSGRPLGCPIV
jgi:hypothetical protein